MIALLLAACGPRAAPKPRFTELRDQVVYDFEHAVLGGKEAYLELFNLAAVGAFEKLLHRYDALGRAELPESWKQSYLAETPEPFTAERERRNLGNIFYARLAQRTVGKGGCRAVPVIDEYAQALGRPFEELPPEHQHFEKLRQDVNKMIEQSEIVGVKCDGGRGGIALVYVPELSRRGYSIITMYDDQGQE